MTASTPPLGAQPIGRPTSGRRRVLWTALPSIPALVWFLTFTIGPVAALFYFSLLRWRSINAPREFVGIENFQRILQDEVVLRGAINSGIQMAISLPVIIVGAFLLAYYLNLKPRGHRVIRTLLFTPILLSTPALAMVFAGVFAPSGLVNAALDGVGLSGLRQPWLANGTTGLGAIIVIGIWSGLAISAVMLAARLSALSDEVFEAAEIDGCTHLQRVRLMAWPMAREFIGVVTTLQFLWILFGSAALILLLTKGGPGNDTVTLSFLVYDYAFGRQQVGYSQAIAIILFVLGSIGLVGIRAAFNDKDGR